MPHAKVFKPWFYLTSPRILRDRSNSLHHIPLNAMRNNGPETIQYDGEC